MNQENWEKKLIHCTACPRLVAWREEVAETKRRQFMDETYWGKPVPSFGAWDAKLLIVGLAPAAHGANRTGRMFTGDESGKWLYRALYRAGLASQEQSVSSSDGLTLIDTRITAMVHCAPPDNNPNVDERDACASYFDEELSLLKNCQVIVCLGSFAWEGVFKALARRGWLIKPKPKFSHGAEVKIGPYRVIGSYHPSQQNTFTGRLTEPMLDLVFEKARALL